MEFKKAFVNKKEIKEFKDRYSSGDIDTEVISNLLQPYHKNKYPEISNYCDFWWSQDNPLAGVLQLLNLKYSSQALEEKFGKPDFSFTGNRLYKNYILEFDGLTIIASDKRELVLPKTKGMRQKLVEFENAYTQFILDFIFNNYDKLKSFEKESLDGLKSIGIIDFNNKVDFQYFEKTTINKMKSKIL
jgi:hypothetical protein